jgi:putative transposase
LVVVRTAYKCRAYPAAAQASLLNRTLAWRHARYDGEQVKTNFAQANAYLTALKATEDLAWLNEVPSVPLQQAIRHQQVACTSFFTERARYPRFKSRTGRQFAEFTRSGFRYRDDACGADVRHSGSSRVQSAVKQEPQLRRLETPSFRVRSSQGS